MTAQRTRRMDDSYVEEAEKDNGRPVSLEGVEPREPRGPGVKADDAVTRFASCAGVGDGDGDRPVPAQPADALVGLLAVLEHHPELDLKTLGYHLQQSDATAADGYCHAAINEARSLLEALVVNIVRVAQDKAGGTDADGNGRERSQNGTAFRTWRRYLCQMGLVDSEENELLQWVYGVASAKGSHHGVTDEAWARLVRRVVLATSHYLLHRYAAWKRQGRATDQGAVKRAAASPAPVNVSWRHRLVRLLGLEATLGDASAAGSGNSRRLG